jgi:ATP-citrate lyase beta-subunit
VSRKKLSEFRAKSLLYQALGQDYAGYSVDAANDDWRQDVENLPDGQYVVKVDQAEKGRFKKGLVKLDQSRVELVPALEGLFGAGYRYALVEPFKPHEASEEKYFAVERTRDGNQVTFSDSGGVDVESQAGSMVSGVYSGHEIEGVAVPKEMLDAIMGVFDNNFFSFLEINPLVIQDGRLDLLDAAVEVDDETVFFEEGWNQDDLRKPRVQEPSPEEKAVQELADKSQASFSLEVINPNGSVFLLLSGGGASVVVADEVYNLGYGEQLANYGEYSGNPNREETRIYTEQVISLLLKSQAAKKVLIIGGGVANFTDVRATFSGVIDAFKAHENDLKEQSIKVFVRRGGPHEKEGLAIMEDYLRGTGLLGVVAGPDLLLSDIVAKAIQEGGIEK